MAAKVRLAEILSALSYALDLVEGQTFGHAVRTCLIAMWLGEKLGLNESKLSDLYYAALLKDAGCSTNSARVHAIFGQDHDAKYAVKLVDWTSKFDMFVGCMKLVDQDKSIPARVVRIMKIGLDRESSMEALTQARCSRGAQIALQLGFGKPVADAVYSLDEHWDGHGAPGNQSREKIPLLARILCLAQTLDVVECAQSREAAFKLVRKRAGRWFDPALVKAVSPLEKNDEFWASMHGEARAIALEISSPATVRMAEEVTIDQVCDAFASIIDAKSSFTAQHSQRVRQYSLEMAEMLGFRGDRMTTLSRAALLHDIGKLGVPTAVLEKQGKLTDEEFLIIKKHPAHSEQILSLIGGFERVTEIAAAHHERLDGRGYHRGRAAEELDTEMRILAVADIFDALTANRPYRAAMELEDAFGILEREGDAAVDQSLVALLRERYQGVNSLAA